MNYDAPKLSNERLRADTVEYLEWVEKAFPGMDYTCIGQPDGWSNMDSADAAAGWDKIERGRDGRFSDYTWDFTKDVSKRILEKHPEKKFTFMAYDATRRPPANMEKLPPNMAIIFCQHAANAMFPASATELEDRNEWLSKMSDKNQLLAMCAEAVSARSSLRDCGECGAGQDSKISQASRHHPAISSQRLIAVPFGLAIISR